MLGVIFDIFLNFQRLTKRWTLEEFSIAEIFQKYKKYQTIFKSYIVPTYINIWESILLFFLER